MTKTGRLSTGFWGAILGLPLLINIVTAAFGSVQFPVRGDEIADTVARPWLESLWMQGTSLLLIGLGISAIWFRAGRHLEWPKTRLSLGLVALGALLFCIAIGTRQAGWAVWGWIAWVNACCVSQSDTAFEGRSDAKPNLLLFGLGFLSFAFIPQSVYTKCLSFLVPRVQIFIGYVLDFMRIPFQQNGMKIVTVHGEYDLQLACSDFRDIRWTLFLGCLLIAWRVRSVFLLPIYACLWLTVSLFVICTNAWVDFTVLAQSPELVDSSVWIIGIGIMRLTVISVLVLSTDRLLHVVFGAVPADSHKSARNPITFLWNRLFSQPFIGAR